jgi:hypothetical protein
VLIESLAQVLAAPIGTQDLYRSTVVLGARPRRELLVGAKRVTLRREEVGERVMSGIIREGDEVASAASGSHGGWPPHIGMYLITELLGLLADPQLGDRLPGGVCIYALMNSNRV